MNSTLHNVAHVEEQRPRSATPFSVGLLGIVAGLLTLWLLRDSTALDGAGRSTAACLAIIATITLYELFVARVYLRPSAGLTGQAVRPLSVARVGLRLAALASVYAGIGLLYWLLPEYHGTFYNPFWSLIRTLAPYLIIGRAMLLCVDGQASARSRRCLYVVGPPCVFRATPSQLEARA